MHAGALNISQILRVSPTYSAISVRNVENPNRLVYVYINAVVDANGQVVRAAEL